MLDFYSESLAKNYFLKRKEHNKHIYLLNADNIEIDTIKGTIFLIKEFERKIETSKKERKDGKNIYLYLKYEYLAYKWNHI